MKKRLTIIKKSPHLSKIFITVLTMLVLFNMIILYLFIGPLALASHLNMALAIILVAIEITVMLVLLQSLPGHNEESCDQLIAT